MRRLALLLALAGCADDAVTRGADWMPDGGAPDVAVPDAAPDARAPDAAIPDAAPSDAAPRDAAPPDAAPDAGPPDCTAEIDRGREELAYAAPHEALKAFEAALARCPDDPDALFGAALAGALDNVELTYMLFSVIGAVGNLAITRDEALAEDVHGELMRLRAELQRALDRANALDPDDVDFEVDAAWLYLGVEPRVVYRGVFDGGDLHLVRAGLGMILGLLDVMCAQDLAGPLLDTVNDLRDGFSGLDFAGIGGLVARLTDDRFLGLHPVDGARVFAESRAHLGAVGREFVSAIEWMRAEDDPRPQVSRVQDAGAGRVRLVVASLAHRDPDAPDEPPAESPFVATFDGAALAALAHASLAFETPGELVPWRTEAIPVLATVLQAGAKFGALDAFLGDALPVDLGALDRPAIEALLGQLMPLPIALDFSAFYDDPTGLRFVLPRTAGGALVAEWECPADLDERGLPSGTRGIVCGGDAVLTDAAHFDATLPPDGLASSFPYLAWDDPTWNGLLWVDLSGLGVPGWDAPGWRRPDLFALDAALSVGLSPLLGLLD